MTRSTPCRVSGCHRDMGPSCIEWEAIHGASHYVRTILPALWWDERCSLQAGRELSSLLRGVLPGEIHQTSDGRDHRSRKVAVASPVYSPSYKLKQHTHYRVKIGWLFCASTWTECMSAGWSAPLGTFSFHFSACSSVAPARSQHGAHSIQTRWGPGFSLVQTAL